MCVYTRVYSLTHSLTYNSSEEIGSVSRPLADQQMGSEDAVNNAEVDMRSHFSFYALDGRTGSLRWKHENGDFVDFSSNLGTDDDSATHSVAAAVRVCTCVYVFMCLRVHVFTCLCVYVFMCICVYVYVFCKM